MVKQVHVWALPSDRTEAILFELPLCQKVDNNILGDDGWHNSKNAQSRFLVDFQNQKVMIASVVWYQLWNSFRNSGIHYFWNTSWKVHLARGLLNIVLTHHGICHDISFNKFFGFFFIISSQKSVENGLYVSEQCC